MAERPTLLASNTAHVSCVMDKYVGLDHLSRLLEGINTISVNFFSKQGKLNMGQRCGLHAESWQNKAVSLLRLSLLRLAGTCNDFTPL